MAMTEQDAEAVASAQGEDRSSFQAVTGWAGFRFGIVKATEGLTWSDPTFAANWAELGREGLPRGAYHFLHPGQDPAAQAKRFIAMVRLHGLKPGDMLWCDSELMAGVAGTSLRSHLRIDLDRRPVSDPAAGPFMDVSLSADAATKLFLDECAALVSTKTHPVGTYTMQAVGQHLRATAAAHPLLWFAHPGSTAPTAAQIAPFKSWRFWQWGIVGGTDRDAYDGTAADLERWLSGYTEQGPFRHLADGTETWAQIAARRHADPEHLLQISAKAYTPGDIAAATALKAPAGLPYYTSNP